MKHHSLRVIDCLYGGHQGTAAAFLLREGQRAAIVETNTNLAVPRILEALEQEGLEPAQVEWVIITHVHLDHAGGASLLLRECPNATLLAHPKAAPHMIDPSRLIESAKGIYGQDTFDALYGTIEPIPEARVRVMDDGEQLSFGERSLEFFYTRGHANHHFCVHDPLHKTVFAGDNFGLVFPHFQDDGLFAFPSTPPTDFDARAAIESIERILATGATSVYPTHFGEVTALEAIAGQLEEQLRLFQRWVDEIDASGRPDEELDGLFTQRVREHLESRLLEIGIPADDPRLKLLEVDIMLNGQGLAFAVKKRRYKAKKALANR